MEQHEIGVLDHARDAGSESTAELVNDVPVPPDVVREVASGLKSLAKVVSYEEYATIVLQIARLKWRCGHSAGALDFFQSVDGPEPTVSEVATPVPATS